MSRNDAGRTRAATRLTAGAPALAVVLYALAPVSIRAQSAEFELMDLFRYDEPAHKTFLQGIGDETVDPFTGTLRIVQTDLVLPGKAGLDLKLVRTYSSKLWGRTDVMNSPFLGNVEPPMLGWGWSFHMGRLRNPHATGALTSPCSGDYPVLELPDGSARLFYRATGTSTHFVSRDRWRMEKDCTYLGGGGAGTCVWSPDGIRYEFPSNGSFIYFGDSTLGLPVSRIVDRFGNAITIVYEPDNNGSMSRITDTYGREITFQYTMSQGVKHLATITAGTHVYTYGFTDLPNIVGGRSLLTSVTPPDGLPFTYQYFTTGSARTNQWALRSIEYPNGGTVSYTYGTASFWPGVGAGIPFAVVQSRTVAGPGLEQGTWTYSYLSGSSGMNETTVLRPDGRGGSTSDVYSMYGFGAVGPGDVWRVGLTQSVSRAGDAEIETYTWRPSAAVSSSLYAAPAYMLCAGSLARVDSAVYEPLLEQTRIQRDTGTFTTTYSNWDAYGQPRTVTETGPAGNGGTKTRTTTLTYFAAPSDDSGRTLNVVKGLVLTRRACIASDCVNESTTYNGPDHAKDSHTLAGVRTTYAYHLADPEGRGNLRAVTNALNQTLAFSEYHYGYGTPRVINFNGAYRYTRTATWEGWVLSLTDGRGNTTRYTYDGIGRLTLVTPPGGNDRTTIVHDQTTTNGVNVVTTRGSYVVTTSFDGLGRQIGTADSVGVHTSARYDALGRKWFESYPYSSSEVGTRNEYDLLGRLTGITKGCVGASSTCSGADRSTVSFTYSTGNCVTTTEQRNPDSLTTTRCYDAFGSPEEAQLTYLRDAAGNVWRYSHTTAGDLKSVTAPDARGNRTYTYDTTQTRFMTGELAPELGIISADSVSVRYTPNAIGQVRTRRDARGITRTYDYTDPLGRLRGIAFSAGTADNVARTYQAGSNNVATVSSANGGTYAFTSYDELDRLRSQTWTFGGVPYATSYTYDVHGCLTRIEYPTGSVVEQTCDDAGRVRAVRLNGASIVSDVRYHASGRPVAITFASGPSTTLAYDDRARLKTLTTAGILELSYTYDGVDNVTTFNNAAVPGSALRMCSTATGTCRDGYDALNRLITVIAPARWGTVVYDYDVLGNRTLKSADQPVASTQAYSYGASNRLESTSGSEILRPMTFTWDAASRLASSSDGATYFYDGLGRRVMKAEASGTTVYHYDVDGRVIAETTRGGERLRDYVYLGNRLIAAAGCLSAGAVPPCSERERYHTDALGSVLARSDMATGAVARLEYQPFGEQWQASGEQGDRQYNGRVYDPGTGFHDYGARMYWPQMGRFVSADPYPGDVSRPAGLNRYSYVLNNPYKYVDPSGNEEVSIQLRAFIPKDMVGPYGGDNRGFSEETNARSRVAVTVRVETDPVLSKGQPLLSQETRIGRSVNLLTEEVRTSTGPQPPSVIAWHDSNGNTRIHVSGEMKNPFVEIGKGIRMDVGISLDKEARHMCVNGSLSGSPSFEANVIVEGGKTNHLPLQEASKNDARFIIDLQRTTQIHTDTTLK
ncbi:MAG TPA: RHS repeat-associated core domain-containing protein [Anaeromyxobacter sp.]|nr:RHS repeat-associated core domain-containing protein [Anaeromyxobacter sp.]